MSAARTTTTLAPTPSPVHTVVISVYLNRDLGIPGFCDVVAKKAYGRVDRCKVDIHETSNSQRYKVDIEVRFAGINRAKSARKNAATIVAKAAAEYTFQKDAQFLDVYLAINGEFIPTTTTVTGFN
jgi:hypothetical protein